MSETLIHICKCHSLLSDIPIRLYFENIPVEVFDPFSNIIDVDLTLPYLKQLFDTEKNINYCVTADLLIMGLVKDKSSPYSIVIGPAFIGEVTEQTARKLITSGLYPLRLDQIESLTYYLHKLSNNHIVKFTHLLSLLNTNINHEIKPANEILSSEIEYEIGKEVEYNMLEKDEEINLQGIKRRNPLEPEMEMLYCIKYGLTNRLKKLTFKGDMSSIGVLAYDTLRHYKNAVIIQNSLSLRAAIAGGLSPESSYQLGEIYIRKIEACTNFNELSELSNAIRLDYCERVRELLYPRSGDPVINKAIHYIDENIHKKITAKEIADMLSISKEYLSTRFKEVTKTSIPEYINKQKIQEAKRLLRLTDKPLSEISEYLSFSSQSYFQNIFKKLVGVTPLAFRKSSEKGIF